MEELVKGTIVVVPFPFSDLSAVKRRPALVVSVLSGDDLILAQITSRDVRDQYAISITNSDLDQGNLTIESNIRPNRLFTADKNIILYSIGRLKQEKMRFVISKIIYIIQN